MEDPNPVTIQPYFRVALFYSTRLSRSEHRDKWNYRSQPPERMECPKRLARPSSCPSSSTPHCQVRSARSPAIQSSRQLQSTVRSHCSDAVRSHCSDAVRSPAPTQFDHTAHHSERVPHAPRRAQAATSARSTRRRYDERSEHKVVSRPSRGSLPGMSSSGAGTSPADYLEHLQWPTSFDDWMMDIVRRRALRLNSGARRRGVRGSVRAVDLAHILDRSADSEGRWRCALCHAVVTLNDLSFDHVVALADGGEHAPYNLVPAHRKCNEIKGSEKAQYRAQALDRWLSDWASTPKAPTGRAASPPSLPSRHAGYLAGMAGTSEESARRYA